MQPDDETPEPVEPAPVEPVEAVPEHVESDPRVELPLVELRALIEQSARESAERVHASYARNAKIQRGLALLEKYERTRAELADQQVIHDARRDHLDAQWRRHLAKQAEHDERERERKRLERQATREEMERRKAAWLAELERRKTEGQ